MCRPTQHRHRSLHRISLDSKRHRNGATYIGCPLILLKRPPWRPVPDLGRRRAAAPRAAHGHTPFSHSAKRSRWAGSSPASISSSPSSRLTRRRQNSEDPPSLVCHARRIDAAMVGMRVPPNESLLLQSVQHLDHRLRSHVSAASELRVREWLPPRAEHAERRVLECGQPVGLQPLVDLSADGALEPRDDVADPRLDGLGRSGRRLGRVIHCCGMLAHALAGVRLQPPERLPSVDEEYQ